jgi:tol-pal system protein YbgF
MRPSPLLNSLLAALLLLPALAHAQKREDILSIQRDVAQLQEQIRQMQESHNQKLTALEGLIKQAMEQQSRIGTAVSSMEKGISDRLNQQQSTLAQPVIALGSKLDTVSEDTRLTRENVADLAARLAALDTKLADISSTVRILSAPPASPPPPPAGSATGAAAIAPPAGVSAETLYQNAFRDYSSGKDELAMMEFTDFLKYFPMSENAPSAQYYIGQIYDRAKQYEDGAQAFDAVLERYPENPKTPDALYWKGIELMKSGKKAEAITEFKDFLARYPSHSLSANARAHLRTLGQAPTPAAKPARRR